MARVPIGSRERGRHPRPPAPPTFRSERVATTDHPRRPDAITDADGTVRPGGPLGA